MRAHGFKGAFVSRWVIQKNTLEVLEGDDLIQTLYLWDTVSQSVLSCGAGAVREP